jgi:hypothetical protein
VDLGDGPVGLITYMRTDSFNISQDALRACRQTIETAYGKEYLPEGPNYYKSRGSAQEAHEAIRPSDVTRRPDDLAHKLNADELKLYSLIWQRFVASQMAPARIEQRTVEVEALAAGQAGVADVPDYLFRATASQVVFPGYMKVSGMPKKTREKDAADKEGAEDEDEVDRLPPLERGEMLELLKWLSERKETQPPGRFSEASLIKMLEENGVGRPSTYASIIGTLYDRKYISKEKRAIQPTDLGLQVNTLLVENLNDLFDVKFTAGMEELLDEVEEGKVEWTAMLKDFYERFQVWMVKAKGPSAESAHVEGVLAALDHVREWGPETKRGRRTYSDKKFADSIREQLDEGAKALSMRQLETLGRLALRYREQIPDLDKALTGAGLARLLDEKPPEPPKPSTIEKLALLRKIELNPPSEKRGRKFDDSKFVESLQRRVDQNRELSPAQIQVLNRLVTKYADRIEGFETLRDRLGLDEAPAVEDVESGALIEQLKHVREWRQVTTKTGKTFDDKPFYESLARQFAQRRSLSPRQKSALKRMARKYMGGQGKPAPAAEAGAGEATEPQA